MTRCVEGGSGGDEPLQLLAETTLHEPGACPLPAACGKCREVCFLKVRHQTTPPWHMLSHPAILFCTACFASWTLPAALACAVLSQLAPGALHRAVHAIVQVFTIAPKEPHPTDAEVRFLKHAGPFCLCGAFLSAAVFTGCYWIQPLLWCTRCDALPPQPSGRLCTAWSMCLLPNHSCLCLPSVEEASPQCDNSICREGLPIL